MWLLFHSLLERGGVHLKLDVHSQGDEKILDVVEQGVGGLEN